MARKKQPIPTFPQQASLLQYNAMKKKVKGFVGKQLTPYIETIRPEVNIDEEISEREKLKNKALAQDITLKKMTLIILFSFLAFETALIFLFAFLQAIHFQGFRLDEWSFRILIGATITQITFMVQLTVKHLFPQKKQESAESFH